MQRQTAQALIWEREAAAPINPAAMLERARVTLYQPSDKVLARLAPQALPQPAKKPKKKTAFRKIMALGAAGVSLSTLAVLGLLQLTTPADQPTPLKESFNTQVIPDYAATLESAKQLTQPFVADIQKSWQQAKADFAAQQARQTKKTAKPATVKPVAKPAVKKIVKVEKPIPQKPAAPIKEPTAPAQPIAMPATLNPTGQWYKLPLEAVVLAEDMATQSTGQKVNFYKIRQNDGSWWTNLIDGGDRPVPNYAADMKIGRLKPTAQSRLDDLNRTIDEISKNCPSKRGKKRGCTGGDYAGRDGSVYYHAPTQHDRNLTGFVKKAFALLTRNDPETVKTVAKITPRKQLALR